MAQASLRRKIFNKINIHTIIYTSYNAAARMYTCIRTKNQTPQKSPSLPLYTHIWFDASSYDKTQEIKANIPHTVYTLIPDTSIIGNLEAARRGLSLLGGELTDNCCLQVRKPNRRLSRQKHTTSTDIQGWKKLRFVGNINFLRFYTFLEVFEQFFLYIYKRYYVEIYDFTK